MPKIKALAIGDNRINLISREEVEEKVGDIAALKTAATNIVDAINEVNDKQGGGGYTAGTGISITGDTIAINQENLNKITSIDSKADKTDLNNYYTKAEVTSSLNGKATTQALTTETNARTAKDTELQNTKVDKVNIADGTPFDTGITIDGKKMYKVIFRDYRNKANDITTLVSSAVNSNTLISAEVKGYSWAEADQTFHFPESQLIYFQGACYIAVITINTVGNVSSDLVDVASCNHDGVRAIEITYLN